MAKRIVSKKRPYKNILGRAFGWLTVIAETEKRTKHQQRIWECKCECGATTFVTTTRLIHGTTRSCGCRKQELRLRSVITHNRSKTPEYSSWRSMRERCQNPNSKYYPRYGGCGIVICERWQTFENFREDMGLRPSLKHTIDRYPNNDGNYEPGNCRWATKKEQSRNTKTNRRLTYNGETKCVVEWAEQLGMSKLVILQRLRLGWSIERTLSTPRVPRRRKHNPKEY